MDFEDEFRRAKEERENPPPAPESKKAAPKAQQPKTSTSKPPKMPSRDRSDATFVKDGWLDKQSDVRKIWKRRYFVCTEDSLNYYKSNKVFLYK